MLNQDEISQKVSDRVKTTLGEQLVMILNLQTQLEEAQKVIGELRVDLATLKNSENGEEDADKANSTRVLSGSLRGGSLLGRGSAS